MDMYHAPPLAVLLSFYRLLGEQAVVVAVLVGILVLIMRSRVAQSKASGVPMQINDAYPRPHQWLQYFFGGLWILDGLLQAQPGMSNQFISGVVAPMISGQPAWLREMLQASVVAWSTHPLFFDGCTVFIQILIGVSFFLGPTRRLGRLGMWASILWAVVVWLLGEGAGGVFNGGTWLTGTPGSVLVYAVAALLLLQSAKRWQDGRVMRVIPWLMAGYWGLSALLQALPSAQFWEKGTLSTAILQMADMSQPSFMAAPLRTFAALLNVHPVLWNASFVALPVLLVLLWMAIPRHVFTHVLTMVVLLFAWWLGQDFGVVGGFGTDPNTALPVLFMLVVYMQLLRVETKTSQDVVQHSDATASRFTPRLRRRLVVSMSVVAGLAIVAFPIRALAVHLLPQKPADSAALDYSGLTPVGRPAPNFTLVNQRGQAVSLSQFRGKAVLLTFLDPVCYDDCPVVAAEMAEADQELGANAAKVELIAVCANPLVHSVAAIDQFDAEHNLNHLHNFEYLTSTSVPLLKQVWQAYGEYVGVPKLGMINHADQYYFITPKGDEKWLANGSAHLSLFGSYANLLADYLDKMLGVSVPPSEAISVSLKAPASGIVHPSGFDELHMMNSEDGWALVTKGPYETVDTTTDGGRIWKDVTPEGISVRGGILADFSNVHSALVSVLPYKFQRYPVLFQTTTTGDKWISPTVVPAWPTIAAQDQLSSDGLHRIFLTGAADNPHDVLLLRSVDGAERWAPAQLSGFRRPANARFLTATPTWSNSRQGVDMVLEQDGTAAKLLSFTTVDGGRIWSFQNATTWGSQDVSDIDKEPVLLDGVHAEEWYAIRGAKKPSLWETKNGGVSWSLVNGRLPDGVLEQLDFVHHNVGYLLVRQAAASRIYVTVDGGLVWHALTNRTTERAG